MLTTVAVISLVRVATASGFSPGRAVCRVPVALDVGGSRRWPHEDGGRLLVLSRHHITDLDLVKVPHPLIQDEAERAAILAAQDDHALRTVDRQHRGAFRDDVAGDESGLADLGLLRAGRREQGTANAHGAEKRSGPRHAFASCSATFMALISFCFSARAAMSLYQERELKESDQPGLRSGRATL
jgi:hypothetical protein